MKIKKIVNVEREEKLEVKIKQRMMIIISIAAKFCQDFLIIKKIAEFILRKSSRNRH